jgi:aminopeptidase N
MPDLLPEHYHIALSLDLSSFTFTGLCEIDFLANDLVSEIRLKALELDIQSCLLTEGSEKRECPFTLDKKKEDLVITLPGKCAGELLLTIIYTGSINDTMAGFYRSSYTTVNGKNYIAVTQFEESDARRAFPCMDHPAYKASFAIEMTIDEHLHAISNEDIDTEEKLPGGKKRIIFRTTPRMSTYLLFFGIGDFEKITDTEDPRVRLFSIPGNTRYGSYGLEFGRKALHFCEDYFGIPYPLSKLDLIAVPDFAFGAMENWGAVTFRENLLLYYPGLTSRGGERRICEVCAHEIVHMWFGNLVTPKEWKYLWLNESFATLFGFGIVAHYHPDWGIWDQFISSQTAGALERDALVDTFPIEIPGGEHVVINSSTSPIIYSKGGSILRQLKEYIGEEPFKKGLHHYLHTYAYRNTNSTEFFTTFEQASQTPVVDLMKSWIEQPGFPLVTVERDGDSLVVRQQRFTSLGETGNTTSKESAHSHPGKTPDQTWIIPLTILLEDEEGNTDIMKTLFKKKEKRIKPEKSFTSYLINPGHTGFYRVHYKDDHERADLKIRIQEKKIMPEDRWGCENDMYALVKACMIPFQDYLDFLSAYSCEDAYLPLTSIAGHLGHSFFVLSGKWEDPIKRTGRAILETALEKSGFEPREGEKFTTTIMRGNIMYDTLLYGSEKAEEFLGEQFHSLCNGDRVHPDILANSMMAGAYLEPEKAWDVLIHRLKTTESEHDRMNILTGISCFSHRAFIEKALAFVLENVPARNKYIPIAGMTGNREAIPLLWDWYQTHLEELEQFHPVHYERLITSIVPICGIGREDEVHAFFREYSAKKDLAAQAISLSLERLDINSRMRKEND